MTTLYYFDFFLQVNDLIRMVSEEQEFKPALYKEGVVREMDIANSTMTVEVEGVTYVNVLPKDTEPVEYREKAVRCAEDLHQYGIFYSIQYPLEEHR